MRLVWIITLLVLGFIGFDSGSQPLSLEHVKTIGTQAAEADIEAGKADVIVQAKWVGEDAVLVWGHRGTWQHAMVRLIRVSDGKILWTKRFNQAASVTLTNDRSQVVVTPRMIALFADEEDADPLEDDVEVDEKQADAGFIKFEQDNLAIVFDAKTGQRIRSITHDLVCEVVGRDAEISTVRWGEAGHKAETLAVTFRLAENDIEAYRNYLAKPKDDVPQFYNTDPYATYGARVYLIDFANNEVLQTYRSDPNSGLSWISEQGEAAGFVSRDLCFVYDAAKASDRFIVGEHLDKPAAPLERMPFTSYTDLRFDPRFVVAVQRNNYQTSSQVLIFKTDDDLPAKHDYLIDNLKAFDVCFPRRQIMMIDRQGDLIAIDFSGKDILAAKGLGSKSTAAISFSGSGKRLILADRRGTIDLYSIKDR
jgi:hypothetical protein